jgi:hypothetical protein
MALKTGFTRRRNTTAHATLICCAAPLVSVDESLTLTVEGADLSRLLLRSRLRVRVREGGRSALTSLSQNCQTTGTFGRLDAWRAWIGPPQGASAGLDCRPLPNPVRDRRNLLQSPMTAVQAPRPSRPVSWRVASVGRYLPEHRLRLRHTLEDGVANAEAPSSSEGLTHRIFLFTRRSPASARIGMARNSALAPKTDASSE